MTYYTQITTLRLLFCLLFLFYGLAQQQQQQQQQYRSKFSRYRKKRKRDSELLWHQKRRRQVWSPLIQNIGPDNFYIHHRVSLQLFNKIHKKIKPHIYTDPKYVRHVLEDACPMWTHGHVCQ